MHYTQIQKIVNKYDPLRLIAIGCPKDEYRAEVKNIKNLLVKDQTQEEVEKVVLKVFNKWFGKDLIRIREKRQLNKIAQSLSKLK
ncbi:MAG: hypothetical protein G01um10147_656 [Microgenomates group bacterium Gr01-1014_7]|nr:MAG: hypothetical protein G01um10147_656 [Microgenomates group bacterium Gr01-1014_7]